jgi:hypothetical protein
MRKPSCSPIFFLLLFGAGAAWADCPNNARTTIVYSNGIDTTHDEALFSLNSVLSPAVRQNVPAGFDQSCLSFALAYDSTFVNSDGTIATWANRVGGLVDAMVQCTGQEECVPIWIISRENRQPARRSSN